MTVAVIFTSVSGVLSGSHLQALLGSFSVHIFKRVKSVAPFSCRLAEKHRNSNAVRDFILETFLRVGDKNGTKFRSFATNIRVSDEQKKRLLAFSHNNSLNRESKHRLKASCFGKPKERAEARAN